MTLVEETWDRESENRPPTGYVGYERSRRHGEMPSMAGFNTPSFEGKDIAAGILAASMLLGPLLAGMGA